MRSRPAGHSPAGSTRTSGRAGSPHGQAADHRASRLPRRCEALSGVDCARHLRIGFVLLAAAIAGWLARRAGLPAVLGYLAVGLVFSPSTSLLNLALKSPLGSGFD